MSQFRGRRPPEAENRAHIPRAIASRGGILSANRPDQTGSRDDRKYYLRPLQPLIHGQQFISALLLDFMSPSNPRVALANLILNQ